MGEPREGDKVKDDQGERRRGMTEEGKRRQPLRIWAEDAFEI